MSAPELERRLWAAAQTLARAMTDAGWPATARDEADAVTVIAMSPQDLYEDDVCEDERPVRDPAAELRAFLQIHDVGGSVHAEGAGLRLSLSSVESADRLTGIVIATMRAPYRAAAALRTALRDTGIVTEPLSVPLSVVGDLVEIGSVELESAQRMRELLGETSELLPLSPDWHAVEAAARAMTRLLRRVCGEEVHVTADAACSTCIQAREHQITVGHVSPAGAERLAQALGYESGTDVSDDEHPLPWAPPTRADDGERR
ncbi:hypothetical protein [Streptomyces sp. NPDC059819]|uniref:hypothetical protein n=1 Tax=Streptomyces sp. NPDC059819 TaxID=3346963 RepID=UPI0036699ACD